MHKKLYTLITGASMGLGKALALECAHRQMNLILVSLPGEGLATLAENIAFQYGVKVEFFEMDLADDGSCERLFEDVSRRQLNLSMLINNAGVGSTEFFCNGCLTGYEKQIRLNVLALTRITHLFLEMLKTNSPSYILNVGSLASSFSLPKKQVYGATKSYISYFSKSLNRELKNDNVFVTVLCPGGMFTNPQIKSVIATGDLITRASALDPEQVAFVAIEGLLNRKEIIVPGKINQAIYFLNGIVPRFIVRFFEDRTMKRLHMPKNTPPIVNSAAPIFFTNQVKSSSTH
jgi:uncharacterized protein